MINVKKKFNFLLFLGISNPTTTTKCFFPTEVHNVFIELRNLTEEVKTYYAFHALLIIIESVLLIASNVTKLVFNYTNNIDTGLTYNRLILIFCILKMQFVFFLVREAHNTIQEVSLLNLLLIYLLDMSCGLGLWGSFLFLSDTKIVTICACYR